MSCPAAPPAIRRPFLPARALRLVCAVLFGIAAGAVTARAGEGRRALSYPYLTAGEARYYKSYRALAARVARSYVRVVVLNKGGGMYDEPRGVLVTASGTIVDAARGYVLTAAHIARGPAFVAKVTTWDGRRLDARILKVLPKRELALLQTASITGGRSAPLANSARIRKGDFALAIGTPKQRMGAVSLGRVRLPNIGQRLDYGTWGFDNAIEIAMEVETGHSGGPVFDARGRLIGIVAGYELGDTSKRPYVSPRITYVVPSNDIAVFLKQAMGR